MSTTVAERTGLVEALDYAARGWAVLPLQPRAKQPHFALAPHAYKSATTDPTEIETWWTKARTLNIGIAAAPSGLVIIDIDRRTLDARGADIAAALPDTYRVETHDGWHLYYRDPGHSYAGKIANGVEVKHRGYVAAPPSTHPSGTLYTVTLDIEPIPFPVDTVPRGVVR